MSDLPSAQRHALIAWANDAISTGWLPGNAVQALDEAITAAPGQLFEPGNRPLVAGLFGGTGVGKSSLLNRFAGEAVARASAERPTSRDITVYVHRSVSVDKLPDGFPMSRMRTALHNNEHYRHVMFIDMPDFDSVETANRDLVDLWLPHLDVVLYVVSPDRYRDDQGWRLLLEHARQHAWMFVMNHWDRGEEAQIADFRAQLAEAGLSDPLIYRSDSSAQAIPGNDDFPALEKALQDSADQSIVLALNELGIVARLKGLKSISDLWLTNLHACEQADELSDQWHSHWKQAGSTIKEGLEYKLHTQARSYAEADGSWLSRLRGQKQTAQGHAPTTARAVDDSVLARLDNALEDFINQQAQSTRVPVAALKQAVTDPYLRARRDFAPLVQDALDRSLAHPGHKLQRTLHKGFGLLCVILPLAAMGWIAWRVVNGFAVGGSNPAAYLGSNFAVNGALMLALAWLMPAFIQRKLQPSREKAALRGLQQGLDIALAEVEQAVDNGLKQLRSQADTLRQRYNALWESLATPQTHSLPEPVRRMLAAEVTGTVHRSLDVRANTHSSTDRAPLS